MTSSDSSRWTSRISATDQLDARDRQIWDELCRSQPSLASAFYTSRYAAAAAAAGCLARVAILERNGEPVAFLPFQFASSWQRLLGAAEPVGGDLSDYFGLVASPDLQTEAVRLLKLSGLSSLLFTHLDESQLALGLTGERPETGLRIDLSAGASAYWAALRRTSKSLVRDTERREGKLIENHGPLRFDFQLADPHSALDALIGRKRAQYARTGVGDVLSCDWQHRLLHQLAQSADPLCQGVMSELYAGDTWVASHFGLRHQGTLHYWFPVYNHELQPFSPGRLLLRQIILASERLGLTAIDRGAGDTPAKRDFANAEHLYYRGLWTRRDLRALCAQAVRSAQWRWSGLVARVSKKLLESKRPVQG